MKPPGLVSSSFRVGMIITLGLEAVLLTASVCLLFQRIANAFVGSAHMIGLCSVAGLFFIHLLKAGFGSVRTDRIYHAYLAVSAVVVCLFGLWCLREYKRSGYSWFVTEGVNSYGELVQIAESNRPSLTDQPRFLSTPGRGVAHSLSACTNQDGALMVWITPRANNPRLGYFHTSSNVILTNCPWDDRPVYFYHLTNGWYEY